MVRSALTGVHVVWTLLVLGCHPADPPATGLLPEDRAIRASMALRGIRPSLDELAAVRRNPTALPDLVDDWLDDPRFGDTIRAMAHETWVLNSGVATVPVNGPLANVAPVRIRNSIADSVPRLIESVVVEDRPYTEILTADYTVADDVVAGAWEGVAPHDPSGPTWQKLPYTDGRPAAGVLSDSYLYVVYRSAGTNYNRGRANTVSRILLCVDFLDNDPIPDTSINLADAAAVDDAVVNNPDCAVCHHQLDPLASFFAMRPYPVLVLETWPLMMYSPLYQDLWQDTTGRAPEYFGTPGDDLGDLAQMIAHDDLFAQCAVRRHLSYFEQTPVEQVDAERVDALTAPFVAGGLRVKALVKDIVLSDAFMTADVARIARPEQLTTLFEDLTGFVWSARSDLECCSAATGTAPYGTAPDMLLDPFIGYRTLAGGVDAPHVSVPTHAVNPTYEMVLRTWAQLAAEHVVAHDFGSGKPTLLAEVGPKTDGERAIRKQLAALHDRLYGEIVAEDSEEVNADWELFSAARDRDEGDLSEAWTLVLTAMLQDIRIATY